MKIKVSIVDDHPIVLHGLSKMLGSRSEIELVDFFCDGSSLLNSLRYQQPDVLILDVAIRDIIGTSLAKIVARQYPKISLLILTNMNQPYYLNLSMKNGAKGYLLKSADTGTLSNTIVAIANGQRYIDNYFTGNGIKWLDNGFADDKIHVIPTITRRQIEILDLISEGFTSIEIAQKLFISLCTVENHRINLFRKFDVKNSVMLVRKALQLGIIK